MVVHDSCKSAIKALIEAEKAFLRGVLELATNISLRIAVKVVKGADVKYAYGYDQKDEGQAHYMKIYHGMTVEELKDCSGL